MKLVTGGAGFVGRHLVAQLAPDHDVTVLDNHATSDPGRAEQLRSLGADVIQHDVVDPLPDLDADAVFHLASPASPVDYGRLPVQTLRTGAEGTRNVLDWARRHDATFLLASTSEIYGDPEVHPQPEDYAGHVPVTGPRAVYDEAKRYAEALTYAYHRTYGLDTRVARIFNTYGPGMRPEDGRVVSTFIHRAIEGQPLPVHGDGSQTRSFCFVADLVQGLVRLMKSRETRPVNLGNQEEVTILELARTVHEVIGQDTGILHLPLPPDDPLRRRPDTTRAREVLGWTPRVPLAEGLSRYAASIRMEVPA